MTIETLTDVERHQLPLYTPYLGSKAIRIIDAHAAERAALTEQVAQLTRERDDDSPPECDNCEAVMDGHMAATSDVCLDCWNRSHDAESEVSRLTEQVAQLTEVVAFLRRQNKQLQVEIRESMRAISEETCMREGMQHERDEYYTELATLRERVAEAERGVRSEGVLSLEALRGD